MDIILHRSSVSVHITIDYFKEKRGEDTYRRQNIELNFRILNIVISIITDLQSELKVPITVPCQI